MIYDFDDEFNHELELNHEMKYIQYLLHSSRVKSNKWIGNKLH